MAITKQKKPDPEALAALKSDVASFASSLGLAPPSTSPSAGFDDSDFRKSGPLKPRATPKIPTVSPAHKKKGSDPEAKPRPHPLEVDPFLSPSYPKGRSFPKLPLMKPSSLSGHWYIDAEEVERRVVGGDAKRVAAVRGMEELTRLVEKKREVAAGLMEQYMRDYETTRRKSGDMRLLEVTARSGTSADKVSAFTCLVEDNPIANVRSLDALLCKLFDCNSNVLWREDCVGFNFSVGVILM